MIPKIILLTAAAMAMAAPMACDQAGMRGSFPGLGLTERTGEVTRGGLPLTLLGPELKVGDMAPDFLLTRNDMTDAHLKDFAGKALLVAAVPSLDTNVCDLETRRFNEEAAGLPGVTVLTVSMDLPFAQGRWCGAHDIKNVITLSDYKTQDFGKSYGVLIKESHLLARTIFVINKAGRIVYIERVPDLAHEPDYEAALASAQAAGS
jgi:thioredoxin-dependent peroxiredoxin